MIPILSLHVKTVEILKEQAVPNLLHFTTFPFMKISKFRERIHKKIKENVNRGFDNILRKSHKIMKNRYLNVPLRQWRVSNGDKRLRKINV